MKHLVFNGTEDTSKFPIALLIKDSAFNYNLIKSHYIDPLTQAGITQPILCLSLEYTTSNKAPVKLIKECLKTVLSACEIKKVDTILVADGNYFKQLSKKRKSEPYHGDVLPQLFDENYHCKVILSTNYQAIFHNPEMETKLTMSIDTLTAYLNGTFQVIGSNIIHHAKYPETLVDIEAALKKLHQYPELTCDIEAFSLDFYKAGIGTCAFAWDQHSGIAFCCDYVVDHDPSNHNYGMQINNIKVKKLLLKFFLSYKGKLIFHNASYDIKVLIYELFMEVLSDYSGLLDGIEVLARNFHCTKIITYLATNSTSGNNLSLKHNAFEYAGNWAQDDIKDIRLIEKKNLLEYNLVDCLATWYVKTKNYPIMIADNQLGIYYDIMLPSIRTNLNMELVGMPIDMDEVKIAEKTLQKISKEALSILNDNPIIKKAEWKQQQILMIAANAKLKKKIKSIDEFKDLAKFNPNSPNQLQRLLHNVMDLPIIDTTDTELPSTSNDTLEKHINHLVEQFNITDEELQ